LWLERKAPPFIAWCVEREASLCASLYTSRSQTYTWSTYFVYILWLLWKNVLWLAQAVFSYFVLQGSKIPLVLTNKVTHLRSMVFTQKDRVNNVVRRVYLSITNKLVPIE